MKDIELWIALEIENKSTVKNPELVVRDWVSKLELDINDAYRLSWDDKYQELCNEQNIERFNEVTFDKVMPKVSWLRTINSSFFF